jgi:hypothetical protein
VVSDEDFAKREERWTFDVPDTKEAYLFRDIFDGKQPIYSVLVWYKFEVLLNRVVHHRDSCKDSCSLDTPW